MSVASVLHDLAASRALYQKLNEMNAALSFAADNWDDELQKAFGGETVFRGAGDTDGEEGPREESGDTGGYL